jgi:hypothetical protein
LEGSWSRRQILSGALATAAAVALESRASRVFAAGTPALRGRFITHVSVVRVNQIELGQLSADDQQRIFAKYPELKTLA